MTSAADIPELWKVPVVARKLDISEQTVRREVKAGRLGFTRVGRSLRFTPDQVLEYINNQKGEPCPNESAKSGPSGSAKTDTESGAARGSTRTPGKRSAVASA